MLKKAFYWDEECNKAFQELKDHLCHLSLINLLKQGEVFYVHLSVSGTAVSSVLIREEGRVQTPVYYTCRAFRGAKERYPRAEKMAFALVVTTWRLRPYFQAHPIRVHTNQPLKTILHKLETSGRLVKWSMDLSKVDIKYHPQGAIKGQVVADFIAEYNLASGGESKAQEAQLKGEKPSQAKWVVYVDDSSMSSTAKGVVLVTVEGDELKYAIRFGFKATNNKAEYEVMLTGLRLARALRAKLVRVNSNSQLVVGQVQGEYEAKDERMK